VAPFPRQPGPLALQSEATVGFVIQPHKRALRGAAAPFRKAGFGTMRLRDKLAKLLEPDAYRSMWRGVQRAWHPLPVRRFLRRIDQTAMAELAARHESALLPGQNWTKYFDNRRWLKLNIRRAQDIGLDRALRPLRVLDLGSGAGYFLFVCRELGHAANRCRRICWRGAGSI
jgi:hypothetical protein